MSFLAPLVVCGLLMTFCAAVGVFSGVTVDLLLDAFVNVLKVFGNGRIWEGILVIAIACGFVGGMFETFNFYYYQNMN